MRKMFMIAVLTVMAALGAACGGGSTAPVGETPVSTPTFTEDEIVKLTTPQVVSAKVFPPKATSVGCVSAYFKPAADMWVVTCNFQFENTKATQGTYTVSDKDGKLVQ